MNNIVDETELCFGFRKIVTRTAEISVVDLIYQHEPATNNRF